MKRKLLTGFAVLSLGLAANTAGAAPAEYHLCTGTTTVTMPDGVIIDMWGYGLDADGDYLTVEPCNVTVPGPAITVSETQTGLSVFLRNGLIQEAVSIIIPGQALPTVDAAGTTQHMAVTFNPLGDARPRVQSFVGEATANGGTAQYHWAGIKPGTYVYHSGSHAQVQVQMGLYGAVTTQDVSGNPYPVPAGAVVSETTIVYSEIDPALHTAVSTGNYTSCVTGFANCNAELALGKMPSTVNYSPVYFLVNGKSFTDKLAAASWIHASTVIAGSERHLLRFINTGIETHVPVLRGSDARWSVIAENGRLYTYDDNGAILSNAKDLHSLVLPALSTKDVLLTVTATDAPKSYAIYDRMLNVTNGAEEQPGGMISFLFVDRDNDNDGVPNYLDNCVNRSNPGQVDTIGKGFGDACNFDINDDGFVNVSDVLNLLGRISPPANTGSLGDFNDDGIVNTADFFTLLGVQSLPLGPSCDPQVADAVVCPLL